MRQTRPRRALVAALLLAAVSPVVAAEAADGGRTSVVAQEEPDDGELLDGEVGSGTSGGSGDGGADELAEVQARREGIEAELAATTLAFEEAVQSTELTRVELDNLDVREQELIAQLASAQSVVATRVRALYKQRGENAFTQILGADDVSQAATRVALMNALNGRDLSEAEEATSLRTQLQQTRVLLADTKEQLAAQTAQLETLRNQLATNLATVKVVEADLVQREERKQFYRNGLLSGTYSCIFDPGTFSFIDSWGFPRSGGRRHQGTDVMAAHGEQVFAITDGVIARLSTGGLGGISLYLNGDDGTRYYYTHLSGYQPGIAVGTRVEAGELIAYNGATGNAAGGAPHVHFQMHPGHGAAVNPFPALNSLCYGA